MIQVSDPSSVTHLISFRHIARPGQTLRRNSRGNIATIGDVGEYFWEGKGRGKGNIVKTAHRHISMGCKHKKWSPVYNHTFLDTRVMGRFQMLNRPNLLTCGEQWSRGHSYRKELLRDRMVCASFPPFPFPPFPFPFPFLFFRAHNNPNHRGQMEWTWTFSCALLQWWESGYQCAYVGM